MKKTACIITGGELSDILLKQMCERSPDAVKIVVDGALETTDALGIKPDCIVGDFDTVKAAILARYPEEIIFRHPVEKDDTDTGLAIEKAIETGCERIVFYGAVGSRLDHSLANIFLLQNLANRGIDAEIVNETNRLYVKKESFTIQKSEQYGDYISLLPLTERVENVTLNGLKYSLRNQTMYREETLGISNEITAEEATVLFDKGMFLVVESKDK